MWPSPRSTEGDSITVQLQPGATIKGRLVDADGRARPGVELDVWRQHKGKPSRCESNYFPQRATRRISRDGSASMVCCPGTSSSCATERASRPLSDGLRSGQTKDLGDVTIGDE